MATISREDSNALKRWDNYRKQVINSTTIDLRETEAEKQARIARLLKKGNEVEAFKYYFPNYATAEFGEFHKRYIKKVTSNNIGIFVAVWSRALAKSAVVMMLTWLEQQRGNVHCTIYASYNQKTAINLLRPLKINLESNRRIINDFGVQKGATWSDDEFITSAGVAFYAFGGGQSPRGIRNEAYRPDWIVLDDMDESEQSRNPKRVTDAADWVFKDLIPTFGPKGGRVLCVGNRFAKDMVLNKVAEKADYIEQVDILTQTKEIDNAEIKRLGKLLDTAKGNERSLIEEAIRYLADGYQPSWPEHYTMLDVMWKIDKSASMRAAQAEYFNNPIVDGTVFTNEMLQDKPMPKLKDYSYIVDYLDPSWKKTSTADTKAWIRVGLYKGEFHIIKAFCGLASMDEMFNWGYQLYKEALDAGVQTKMYMEDVFAQGIILDNMTAFGKAKGFILPVMADKRKKPDKDQRIESISGYFERGNVFFNAAESNNHHMKRLKEQLLAFQPGVKSPKDGPDALEGAMFLLIQNNITADNWIVGRATDNNRL